MDSVRTRWAIYTRHAEADFIAQQNAALVGATYQPGFEPDGPFERIARSYLADADFLFRHEPPAGRDRDLRAVYDWPPEGGAYLKKGG